MDVTDLGPETQPDTQPEPLPASNSQLVTNNRQLKDLQSQPANLSELVKNPLRFIGESRSQSSNLDLPSLSHHDESVLRRPLIRYRNSFVKQQKEPKSDGPLCKAIAEICKQGRARPWLFEDSTKCDEEGNQGSNTIEEMACDENDSLNSTQSQPFLKHQPPRY